MNPTVAQCYADEGNATQGTMPWNAGAGIIIIIAGIDDKANNYLKESSNYVSLRPLKKIIITEIKTTARMGFSFKVAFIVP